MASPDAGNWAENPYNFDQTLRSYSTHKLLFMECHKNCVDYTEKIDQSHKACI